MLKQWYPVRSSFPANRERSNKGSAWKCRVTICGTVLLQHYSHDICSFTLSTFMLCNFWHLVRILWSWVEIGQLQMHDVTICTESLVRLASCASPGSLRVVQRTDHWFSWKWWPGVAHLRYGSWLLLVIGDMEKKKEMDCLPLYNPVYTAVTYGIVQSIHSSKRICQSKPAVMIPALKEFGIGPGCKTIYSGQVWKQPACDSA